MTKDKRHNKKDFIKKKHFTITEIKKILIKSVLQNHNVSDNKKAFAAYKLSQFRLYSSISKQNSNICMKTGRYKGIVKNTNLSRHYVKTLGISGDLQNFKIANW